MRILVFGGAGFLGSELVNELAKVRSNQIQVVDSFTHGFPKKPRRKKNIELPVVASITNFRDVLRVMERFRPDTVFHLAAFNSRPETFDNFRLCAEVNYVGTANVVHAITALRERPKQLVFASTLAAAEPQSHFGISKRAAEELILTTFARFEELGVQATVLRFAEIYGPSAAYTSTSLVNFFVDNMLLGHDLAVYSVKEQLDCLHITDAVQACISAAKVEGVFRLEVGTGQGVPILDLVNKVKQLTGYKGQLRFLEDKRVPIRSVIANPEPAKEKLGFIAQAGFEESLQELVKKRKKVLK